MTAYVVTDQSGTAVSYGTVLPTKLSAGLTANPIADADYQAILAGLKTWRNGAVADTGLAAQQANQQTIQDRLDAALPLNVTFQGQTPPTVTSIATAQTAVNTIWADMQKMSQAIVGLIYLARGRNDTTSGT